MIPGMRKYRCYSTREASDWHHDDYDMLKDWSLLA